MKKKISILQGLLGTIQIVLLIVSNILTIKQMQIGNITLPTAAVIFPIIYILSDVFSECYGYKWSRYVGTTAVIINLFAVLLFQFMIITPYPDFFEKQEAVKTVLGATPRIVAGSSIGMFLGDLTDDLVFRKMKKNHQDSIEGFKARAITSSLLGEIVDSTFFFSIAFIGIIPIQSLISMALWQTLFKVLYEAIISPLTEKVAKTLNKYESEII